MSPAEKLLLFSSVINLIILVQACYKTPIHATPAPNFYMLALQWGISFCRQSGVVCRQPVLQNFTIHGLWLYGLDDGAMLPPYTAAIDLYSHRVRVDHIPGINENWPNLLAGASNIFFWNQQWRKHGQGLGLPPEQYFRIAICLKKQIEDQIGRSLTQFFKDKGLPPDEIKRYDPRNFLIRIMVETGLITQMQCNMNRDGVYQLAEIRFCFDGNWELTDCPSHNQPAYPTNKNATKKYNPQGKTLHPQPSFHIGICGGKGQILFPALIPASPPPPRRPRKHPPPPPPPKSSPLKPEHQPPLPPPPKKPLIPSPPTSHVLSFAAMLRKELQSPPASPPPPRRPNQHPPPPPPPPPKSSPLKPEHQPPLPPPPKNPLISSPPTSRVLSFAAVLRKGLRSPPASSAPKKNAKRGGAWRHFLKLILTLQKFLIHVGVVGALRTLRGTAKSSRKKNVRWMTFIYFFHCFGPLKMKRA